MATIMPPAARDVASDLHTIGTKNPAPGSGCHLWLGLDRLIEVGMGAFVGLWSSRSGVRAGQRDSRYAARSARSLSDREPVSPCRSPPQGPGCRRAASVAAQPSCMYGAR